MGFFDKLLGAYSGWLIHLYYHAGKKTMEEGEMKDYRLVCGLVMWGFFFCARLVLTSVTSTVIQGMYILSLGQTSLVLLLNLVHHLLSLHTKTEDTMFLPEALLTTEQVENDYPTLSCQCPDRCRLFQGSLSEWISLWSG